MNLWLFERKLDYDTYYGFPVRAETQEQAWQLVRASKYEGALEEQDDNKWKCRQVTEDGIMEIIHESYSSG